MSTEAPVEIDSTQVQRRYLEQIAARKAILDQVTKRPATLAKALDPEYRIRPHTRVISDAFVQLRDHDQGTEGYDRILLTTPPQIGKPLAEDVLVMRGDGSRVRLGAVRVGDEVITHRSRPRRVGAVHVQGELPCLRIITASGRSTVAAYDHPFLTRQGWILAGRLVPGADALYSIRAPGEAMVPDLIVKVRSAGVQPCRCLTVEDDHTFTADELVVHNSITAGVWAPLWWLIRHPRHRIVVSSYSGLLALKRGRAIRDLIATHGHEFGLELAKAPRAADDWSLTTGGGCRSVGVGGGLTGHSADCVSGTTRVVTPAGKMTVADLCQLEPSVMPEVLSWDHATGRAEYRRVQATRVVEDRPVAEVVTVGGRRLRCTPDHRIYTVGGGYVAAGGLEPGHQVLGWAGGSAWGDTVSVVRRIHGAREPVFDLQIEHTRNFFAEGVLVHNCLICDDPVQDREQAESLLQRDKIDDWWSSVAMTRLSPGAPCVLIMTRWGQDDQAGRLLDREGTVEDGGRWKVIHMPAVADLNVTGGVDPLGRVDGEPLTHPKIASSDVAALVRHWEDKRASVNMRDWHAMFQCDPKPAEGALVTEALLRARRHIPAPAGVERVRYGVAVDPSAGGRDLAGIIGGWLGSDGRVYLSDDNSRNGYSTTWGLESAMLCAEQGADFVMFEKSGLLAEPDIRRAFDSAWDTISRVHNGKTPDEFIDPTIVERARALTSMPDKPLIKIAQARKGKLLRAEPIAQQWYDDRLRTSSYLPNLESEWVSWLPTDPESPGRIDASVYLVHVMLQIPGSEAVLTVSHQLTREQIMWESQRRQAEDRVAQPQMGARIERRPMRPGMS